MGRVLAVLLLAGFALPAAAISRIAAGRIAAGATVARDVRITLAEGRVDVAVAGIEAPAGTRWRDATWSCELSVDERGERCAGAASARLGEGRSTGTLSLERTGEHVRLALASGRATAEATRPHEGPIALRLRGMPLAWLAPAIATATPKLAPGAGTIDARLSIAGFAPLDLAGTFALQGVAFDSADGAYAATGLTLRAELTRTAAARSGAARTVLTGRIESGQWLASSIYVDHTGHPVDFAATIESSEAGHSIPAWSWRDEGTLVANGRAELARDGTLRRLEVERYDATLERAWPRYAQPALAGGAWAALAATGAVRGQLALGGGRALAGDVELVDVALRDPDGRYAIEGLTGELALAPPEPRTTSLAWDAASLYRIAIGAGRASLVANRSGHALAAPLVLETLGGRVRVPKLALARTDADRAIEASFELESLSVRTLTEALDWPPFDGTLGGRIPDLRVEGERVVFDGALELDVFDGRVELGGLVLERPFGVAPSLAADVEIDDLALKPLTEAFSFGTIEGRLDGRIDGLRLVDWKPIEFALSLRTDAKRGERRRISQRAVNALSTVGGAGAGAGIQRGMLRMFDTFPYAEIGLTCTLRRNVCTMGGLDSSGGGYTIVRGAGLPRLTVIGHQRRVDWPVLVARLEAATRGAGPVID